MKRLILFFCVLAMFLSGLAQQRVPEATELYTEVRTITPGDKYSPPSDAEVLFDGTSLDAFQTPQAPIAGGMYQLVDLIPSLIADHQGDPAPWRIDNGDMVVVPGKGSIATRRAYGDVQLHIEWLAPAQSGKKGQQYSNSGVFFMGLYEVQILNSHDNPTYSNGQAASVYKQHIPLVNASRPVDTWQYYDIIFIAPRFSDRGTLIRPATITVLHNGVLVQNNVQLLGPTCYIGAPYYLPHPDKLPLVLQDHGDPIRFRNIWIREL